MSDECDSPCVHWEGTVNGRGYGIKWVPERKRNEMAHRIALAEKIGWEALDGKVVMHLCDTPLCVNADHLQAGTQSENMRDWSQKYDNASKTHCPQGHEYAEGARRCNTCQRLRYRETRGKGKWTWKKYRNEVD